MPTQQVNITLTNDEALVLLEFLSRLNEEKHRGIFEDQSEEKTLWIIEAQLETQLSEPFLPNYKDLVDTARINVRNKD